ncbi:hypothetical protein O3P69_002411 [Scylla paramamosain]|uniref:Uncharacterized protein n=1 Tax=Scylla paramamosain TaxID=85552 RepID=A0AAW0V8M4_SCYPA
MTGPYQHRVDNATVVPVDLARLQAVPVKLCWIVWTRFYVLVEDKNDDRRIVTHRKQRGHGSETDGHGSTIKHQEGCFHNLAESR